jgi:hypothetical protein
MAVGAIEGGDNQGLDEERLIAEIKDYFEEKFELFFKCLIISRSKRFRPGTGDSDGDLSKYQKG